MTRAEPAPGTDDGFVHLGALPRDADDLVACVLPELLAARERGHRVVTVLDRPTGRRLREALAALLGRDDASVEVEALVPSEVHASGPEQVLATVRRRIGTAERALLVVQQPQGSDARAVAEREREFDRVFTDQPVTLVCATPHGDHGDLATVVCSHHRLLLERAGRRTSPAATPEDRAPVTLRAAVRGPGDLRGVRESVARMAGGVGLDTDETAAAVLAVHEAALLATGAEEAERSSHAPGGDLPPGTACVVEVRAEGAGLVTEVTGPAAGPEPSLRVVRLFSADAEVCDAVHDGVPVRAVRVRSASA